MHKPIWFAISDRSYINLNEVTSVHFDSESVTIHTTGGKTLTVHDHERTRRLRALLNFEATE